MATTPVQPGAAPANSDAHQTSRRAVLGALAVAPIVALPISVAGASASSSDWNEALRAYRVATEVHSKAVRTYDDAWSLYRAAKPKAPTFTLGEVEEDYGRLGKLLMPVTVRAEELDAYQRMGRAKAHR